MRVFHCVFIHTDIICRDWAFFWRYLGVLLLLVKVVVSSLERQRASSFLSVVSAACSVEESIGLRSDPGARRRFISLEFTQKFLGNF